MVFDVSVIIFVSTRRRNVTRIHPKWWSHVVIVTALAVGGASADEVYDLSVKQPTDATRLVKAVVEVNGELKLNADGSKVTKLPLRVRGDLEYAERTLEQTETTRTDARFYETGTATIQVADAKLQSALDEDHQLIVARVDGTQQTLFSPLGPLSRDELELVDIQGSTTLLNRLTPIQPVALGTEWSHEADFVAAFLGLDAVADSDVKSTLRTVEGAIAIIDMSGKVSGAVDGVSSDIVLKAKYNVDLKSHTVTWLAMSIREDRAIGHATPGFEVTARIRVATSEQPTPPSLADEALAGLPLSPKDGTTLISLASKVGGFSLLHARAWQVMIDRPDVTILRLVDQGDLIAQCNLSSLHDLEPGKRVTLDALRADIQKALGDNFGEFVEASQRTNQQGLRVLRAVVSGVASELPIQWIYYHISNDEGRQVALVFTMDNKVVEKFAASDDALVTSFAFAERDSVEPTPASVEKRPVDEDVR